MIALVFGIDADGTSTLLRLLEERGHVAMVAHDLAVAKEMYDVQKPALVFVGGTDGDFERLVGYVRRMGGDRSVIVGCLRDARHENSLADVDDTIVGSLDGRETAAKIALVEHRAERRHHWSVVESDLRGELSRTQRLAHIGTWHWNVSAGSWTWADEVFRLIGYEPGSFRASLDLLLDRVHPDDRAAVAERFSNVRTERIAQRFTFRIVGMDGSEKFVHCRAEAEENGTAQPNIVGVFQDVSRLVASEVALEAQEKHYQAILETTVDGIITIDDRGTIQSFNRAAEEIFGFLAADVIGSNVKVLMPDYYASEHDSYIRSYLETGHRKIIGIGREVVGKRKDGSTFPMDLAVSEVQVGARRFFSGIVRDVSERRQLEQQILRISEQERQRIGQDLHDGLGQMLTGIGLIAKNLANRLEKKDLSESSDMREITDLIGEADEYARSLARGLIPVELDAGGLTSAFHRLASNAHKLFGIECTFEQVGGMPDIDNAIATHLYRIGQEGLSNAVRHGQASHVRIVLASGQDQVRLRLTDNGRGIPEAINEGHPGMGIRIMRYRARIIGAVLEIRKRIEGGTIIICTLPAAALPPRDDAT